MNEHSIFVAALDITDSTERANYVSHACSGNPALRRQVETLLAAHERSGDFLDIPALKQIVDSSPTPGFVVASSTADDETSVIALNSKIEIELPFLLPSTKPGSLGRLGHYEIEEVIGKGGCGTVLKAFDEILHRIVAIKVMAPELAATSPARKRFLREARAAAAIRHENVVGIHAVEETPIPFIVMEFISARTLQQMLDQTGPLSIRQMLEFGVQIANGLEAAHSRGLIHRDIKPGNILIENGKSRVKITDFGLARSADDASLTQSGVIAGTPLYMSPEQAQGETIDQRSDLFSLGSVLYVMCSGRPPFRAATTMAVLKRVVEDEPRPIQEIIPEVPNWMTAIISRLHSKNPQDRFASARETASVLEQCLLELQRHERVDSVGQVLSMMRSDSVPQQRQLASQDVRVTPAATNSTLPAPTKMPRWIAASILFVLALAGLGMTESTGATNVRATVIRFLSSEGTLVVEVEDPAVSVTVDGEDVVITGTGASEIRLKPGHYKVLASKNGKVVRQELVTVTRNGRQLIRVSKESPPVADAPKATVVEEKTGSEPMKQAVVEVKSPRPAYSFGTWEIVDDVLEQKSDKTPALLLFGSAEFEDVEFSCELWRGVEDVGMSLVVQATDSQHYTYAEIGAFNNMFVDLEAAEAGGFRRLGVTRMSVATDRWIPVKVRIRGKSIEVYVDNEVVVQGDDDLRPRGYVGLRTWNGGARFRNLKVVGPDGKALWQGMPDLTTPAEPVPNEPAP